VLTLFFTDQINDGSTQTLDNDDAHHAIKVLRLKLGEVIKISDGVKKWVSGSIIEISKKELTISISERGDFEEKKPELVLVQAVTKSERNKEMLELAIEAGVDRIIPWQAERSISKWQSDSAQKWEIGIKEACKQARQVRLPKLMPMLTTAGVVQLLSKDARIIVFHESASEKFAQLQLPESLASIYLVIGPEGGISQSELSIFENGGSKIVRLGETVLRDMDCLFCKIVNGTIPANIVKKNELFTAFNDITPQAPTHILIIPNKHFTNMAEVANSDPALAGEIFRAAGEIASENGLESYRMNVNTGAAAGQSVFHAHLHLLAGRSFAWPPG
jgi:RsmE family RNA methyltransferase